MKGVRFYQDENGCGIKFRGWKKSFPNGFNGLLVLHENRCPDGSMEACGALQFGAGDGVYCSTSVAHKYLEENCRRIGEKEAKELFPNMFATYFDEKKPKIIDV